MSITNQLCTMLELQNQMNSRINADWRSLEHEWYRAIWVECGEMLDHYGWKWWKKQTPDLPQVQLELIDIWHFGLSDLLQGGDSLTDVANEIAEGLNVAAENREFPLALEAFTLETLTNKRFPLSKFGELMALVDLSFDALYSGYVGKNVLNFFRQDNGYQDGSYRKIWSGKEDNEHLVEVIAELDPGAENFRDALYHSLQQRYQAAAS